MSEGLFGDLDIASASDDPFGIPLDTYEAVVSKVEKTRNKNDDGDFLVFYYNITGGAAYTAIGQDVQEWKKIPTKAELESDDKETKGKAERGMSFIKQRLISLGVPEARVNQVKPEDLVGTEVYAKIGPGNQGYPSVKEVKLREDSATPLNSGTFSPGL